MAIRRSTEELEENKYHSLVQEGQEGEHRELQTGQPHLDHRKGDRTTNPGKHFQACEG